MNKRILKTIPLLLLLTILWIFPAKAGQRTAYAKDDVIKILMMGIDYNNYSDATILVSINNTEKTVSFISILRDMNLDYGNFGYLHYNNGFRYGGGKLMKKMTEDTLKIGIDAYAFVHFDDMANIFNLLGGLTLNDVSEEMVASVNSCARGMASQYKAKAFDDITKSGKVHMNGYQLVAFCRERHSLKHGDRSRTENQRKVFTAMFNKIRKMSLDKQITFFSKAMKYVSTSLSATQYARLISLLPQISTYTLKTGRVPQDGTFILSKDHSEISEIDFKVLRKYLYNLIFD